MTGRNRHSYWWDEHRNLVWHLCQLPVDESFDSEQFEEFYVEVVDWLYDNIENCERHCRWRWRADDILVKFRYERDLLVFTLRWT